MQLPKWSSPMVNIAKKLLNYIKFCINYDKKIKSTTLRISSDTLRQLPLSDKITSENSEKNV